MVLGGNRIFVNAIVGQMVAFHKEIGNRLQVPYLVTLAHEYWRDAHAIRRRIVQHEPSLHIVPADDVDWAVHEIEDEAVYEIALAAFVNDTARLEP